MYNASSHSHTIETKFYILKFTGGWNTFNLTDRKVKSVLENPGTLKETVVSQDFLVKNANSP